MSSSMSSRRFREWNLDCKVYIGNLSETASKQDVENVLLKYGKLKNVWVARKPPGFAFVEYEDPRDADDAVRALDGTRICGSRVRVEKSHGRSKRAPPTRRGYSSRDNGRYYPKESRDSRSGRGGGGREHRSPIKRGRTRSRSRSPIKRRYTRSRSYSRSHSRGRSMSPRSPPRSPRSPRSPPPRSPRSRSGSPILEKSPKNGHHHRHDDSRSMTPDD